MSFHRRMASIRGGARRFPEQIVDAAVQRRDCRALRADSGHGGGRRADAHRCVSLRRERARASATACTCSTIRNLTQSFARSTANSSSPVRQVRRAAAVPTFCRRAAIFSASIRAAVPTPTAWANGKRAAKAILDRYVSDHGEWPRAIVLDLWGSATLRTGGEELATALALLGVRPVWDRAIVSRHRHRDGSACRTRTSARRRHASDFGAVPRHVWRAADAFR